MNTMADLRRLCAKRLRESLHGKEIDTLENNVAIPHMLGIVPIGVDSNYNVEEHTILDPKHEFWRNFEESVETRSAVKKRVESAVRGLRKDDIFRMTYPYGEEADIVYCEVDELQSFSAPALTTTCAECDESIEVPLSLHSESNHYFLRVTIDCPYCDFSRILGTSMIP